jgi:uncharacterized coiled-coil DUF342 family protein
MGRRLPMIVCLVSLAVFAPTRAGFAAQQAGGRQGGGKNQAPGTTTPAGERPISPAEVRKMFDSYALMQAQEQLKISDEQFPKFLMQYKALLELRRKTTQERNQMIQELRKEANAEKVNEAQLKDRLKALHDFEERSHVDLRKAYDEIDKLLDVRQEARFRVFEQQMDQRMAQLVARARRSAPPKAVK